MEYNRVQRVLIVILVLNLAVAAAKAVFGILAASVSMVADSFHSAFDSASNIIGLISTEIAKRPPDGRHPYGHGKFESLGTLIIGGLLMLTAVGLLFEGISRLQKGEIPSISSLTIGVMAGTIVVNIIVAVIERRMGEQLQSQILIADSEHTKSDVYVSLSVLAGFGFVMVGYPVADPLIACGIALIIARMGIRILRAAGDVLTDAAMVDCEDDIRRIVRSIHGVHGYHKFRCRGKPGELFADLHVFVDPAISVEEGHAIADHVRDRILAEIEGMDDVVVHVDPFTGQVSD
ncbi:MAG: cation transporter [Methanomicrobiales archaeon]|nr:cation transporter [Methanomicrobiales archaeon]